MARPKPLAELIDSCIGPAFAAQGFASTDILAAWPEIVGERLARYCRPAKPEWPRRRRAVARTAVWTVRLLARASRGVFGEGAVTRVLGGAAGGGEVPAATRRPVSGRGGVVSSVGNRGCVRDRVRLGLPS